MDSEITLLNANRVALRLLEPDDASAMTTMMQNWNVLRMLSSPPHPYRLADAEEFIASRREQGNTPEDCTFAVVVDSALAGVISIEPNTKDQPELGYWLGEGFWGKGLMSEAVELMVDRFFETSQAGALYCAAFIENPASIRIQEKVGFTQLGETEIFSKSRDCKIKSVATRLTRDEFERQKQ
ncbi:MAG: GNAT family N-acetyltransferase [Pseudomonadota bacterium]